MADFLENEDDLILDEDFSMGVGGPCGLDQGIPHGGDCKGCCPQRMGLYQRSPFSVNPFFAGVAAAHHPGYWLGQIPKKKKRRKKKRRKLHEDFGAEQRIKERQELMNSLKKPCFAIYYKLFGKEDCAAEHVDTEELYQHFCTGFDNDITPPIRSYEIGKFARRLSKMIYDKDDLELALAHFKKEVKLHGKLLAA
jgi:hypothetical protein